MSAKLEVKLIFTIVPMENSFNVKYLENGDRYHVGVNEAEYETAPELSIGTMTFDLG